jgi:hypothetical protein
MKYSRERFLKANIELSLSNTKIILNSIDSNLKSIIEITQKMQVIDNNQQSIMCLLKIKDMSMESVLEKCNMLKAALDRFTIPYEDVVLPVRTKYSMLHRHRLPRELRGKNTEYKRFRSKISKTNLPAMIAPPMMSEDDGCDDSE